MNQIESQSKNEFIDAARPLLERISALEIIERKGRFRDIDLRKISDESLKKEIVKVVSIDVNGNPHVVNIQRSLSIGENHLYPVFYRVRKLSCQELRDNEFLTMKKEDDAWYPPARLVKNGRLNREGEPVLYLADSPLTAIKETHLQVSDLFYLMVYRPFKSFRVSHLGLWEDIDGFTTDENLKLKLFNDFFITEFTRDVGAGTEYLYRSSELIGKEHLHHPLDVGWVYPSVSNKRSQNICFKPNIAKNYLKLVGVRVCRLADIEDYNLAIIGDAIEFDSNGNFIYTPANSRLSSETFRIMSGHF